MAYRTVPFRQDFTFDYFGQKQCSSKVKNLCRNWAPGQSRVFVAQSIKYINAFALKAWVNMGGYKNSANKPVQFSSTKFNFRQRRKYVKIEQTINPTWLVCIVITLRTPI